MIYALIGLIVGIIVGLTGAGGALISIPLFLILINSTLKEASVLSLIAVILGTSINLFGQKYKIEKKLVFSFVGFGGIANFASLPLKPHISDLVMAMLITLIAIYSIWSIWQNQSTLPLANPKISFLKLALPGLILGVITTMTGLGGGVLLVPMLMRGFGKSYEQALPTSLATIFLISLISFLLQIKSGLELVTISEIFFIAIGTMVAFLLLNAFLRHVSSRKILLLRKIIFSAVTLYSIITIILNIS
jgi:uncharacterized membrane protein YfcA